MDDDENYDDEQDQEIDEQEDSNSDYEVQAERGAWDRTSHEDPFIAVFDKPEPSDEKEHLKWVRNLSKKERFYYTIRSEVLPEVEEKFREKIDKKFLVEKTMDLVGLEYKNPWAFVLGFISRKLSRVKVQDTFDRTPQHIKEQYGITRADIVRYARYWNKFIDA